MSGNADPCVQQFRSELPVRMEERDCGDSSLLEPGPEAEASEHCRLQFVV